MSEGDREADPLAERLAAFSAQADRARDELRVIQAEIDALLTMPDLGVVTIALDARGGIARADVDPGGRERLGAEGLNYEINRAIAKAQRDAEVERVSDPDQLTRPATGFEARNLSAEAILELAFGHIDLDDSWAPEETTTVWNLQRTVGVTLDSTGVRSVDFEPRWLDSASAPTIAGELVVASTRAFDERDRKKEADSHG